MKDIFSFVVRKPMNDIHVRYLYGHTKSEVVVCVWGGGGGFSPKILKHLKFGYSEFSSVGKMQFKSPFKWSCLTN